ncbi:PBP1A family penicillin-binding protein [Phenylobacterium sp.]|uniref:multimodular transpeptidase-transglycosylase PbpC n=1 Tax=Phenylobacterium sp. TaxID=1871053 RepID=UPI002731B87D|nr:PBP1A family penicillin-binding protein [Phenylobacterium sp.]MDP1873022.1 PBP1A family penicillin-binding protein [Phenylobacterium sp.]
MNDWTLDPYRFPDDEPGRPRKPRAPQPRAAAPDGQDAPPSRPVADEDGFGRRPLPPPIKAGSGSGPGDGDGDGPGGPFVISQEPRRGRRWGWVWKTLIVLALLVVAAVIGGGVYLQQRFLQDIPELPPRSQLYAFNRAPGIKFFDRNGELIASRGPRYGDRVRLTDLPPHVPLAFMAAEDHRFYQHGPIDLQAIARATYVNWRAGRVVQGGSTLSQQIAKSLFLTPDQTFERKMQEAALAWRLERMLTKDEVLELYLNRVFFGANTFGVDGAARTYFGKPASQLTLAESALLAALPKAPSRLALTNDMPAALVRSRWVLQRMHDTGWITREEMVLAQSQSPALAPTATSTDGPYGYLLDHATNEVLRRIGPNSPDLLVRLSIDPVLQDQAAAILSQIMASDGVTAGAEQAALVTLGPDGSVRAMVGGVDYARSVFNRATQAKRQPGSTFKPFVYAAALEKGVLPTDVRVDGPVRFGDWRPGNYGGGYRGPVTVETALSRSINTVAVKLGAEAGGPALGDISQRFGLTSIPRNPDLSVTLGAYEVNLLELTSGFQVFQQAGGRLTPSIIEEIRTVDGQAVFSRVPSGPLPALDISHASMMVKMMSKVLAPGGTGARAAFDWPAAGKTGTSQNWRDAWFVGFTAEYVTGVWVGNDDDTPMNRVTGGAIPAQIWRRLMIEAHKDLEVRDFDWLLPDPEPMFDVDPRNTFYQGLASDFANAAVRAEPPPLPPPPSQPQPRDEFDASRPLPEEDIPF